jgi:hypothetical protein
MTNKESFQVLGIGFLFSAIYVGILALFPVAWAIGNLVLVKDLNIGTVMGTWINI